MASTNFRMNRKQQLTEAASLKLARKRFWWCAAAIVAFAAVAATVAYAVTPANGGSVGGSTIAVDNSAGDQLDPHVSGDLAAYTDASDPAKALIRYFDFLTPVSPNASIPAGIDDIDTLSDVNSGHIAFARFNTLTGVRACMVFDVASHTTITIGSATQAGATALGGDTVAFVNGSPGEIMVGSISNPGGPLTDVSASGLDDRSPAVSPAGDVITWSSCDSFTCSVMKSTRTGGVWSAPSVVRAAPAANPDTDGVNIVYDSAGDIFFQPVVGGADTQLVLSGVERNPSISGGVIAFESSVDGASPADLFVYQISTNTLYRVTDTPLTDETLNDVTVLPNGDVRVVWAADDDSSQAFAHNIYARTFTLPQPQPSSFQICLLYDPLVAKKSGSVYPIKLQLCDGNGQNLSSPSIAVHAISVTQASTNAPGPLDDTGNANPDNDFRFDATLGGTGGYIFNLSLRGAPTGTYNLNFTVGSDPTVRSVRFAVK
jgi:hypothetical protein